MSSPKSPLSAKNKSFKMVKVKLTFSLKRLNLSNLDKKMPKAAVFSYKEISFQRKLSKKVE